MARCKLSKALSVCHPISIRATVISLVPPHLTVITYFGGHHTTPLYHQSNQKGRNPQELTEFVISFSTNYPHVLDSKSCQVNHQFWVKLTTRGTRNRWHQKTIHRRTASCHKTITIEEQEKSKKLKITRRTKSML